MPLPLESIIQDRYRIDALLGQGGMGAVYRTWDLRLKIPCAIKENIASRQYQNMAAALAHQFEREATILAALHHPNLPRVTNYFLVGDDQYLVMDYVEGEDLASHLARSGALPEREVLGWATQVCEALSYLHTRPGAVVIHRDIKPANIKITSEGRVMLVDFGLSKVYDPNLSTVAGARGWSSGFSPPEQYDRGTDARSDQYALAATLYALLTGQIPPDALERQMGYKQLKPLRALAPNTSTETEDAILQAMSISPAERFDTVARFQARLTPGAAPLAAAMKEPSPTIVSVEAALVSKSRHTYVLGKAQNLIGRRNRNTGEVPDIDLSDEVDGDTVSRKHAWINWEKGVWLLQPHEAHKNLVKINGRAVTQGGSPIHQDDQIQIGGVVLVFKTDRS